MYTCILAHARTRTHTHTHTHTHTNTQTDGRRNGWMDGQTDYIAIIFTQMNITFVKNKGVTVTNAWFLSVTVM